MTKPFIILFCFLAVIAGTVQAQVGKLYPVDEGPRDSTFQVFRMHLIEALAGRDTTFVLNHLSPDIRTSFGGNGGIEEFKAYWFDEAAYGELWPTLARVVAAGGTFSSYPLVNFEGQSCEPVFMAPYYSSAWPANVDPFDYAAALGDSVTVHQGTDAASPVLATLTFDLIRVVGLPAGDTNDAGNWMKVQLRDGQRGFVRSRQLGSPVGYRATFAQCNGTWLLTSLLAGD